MKFNKRKIFFSANLRFLRSSRGLKQSDVGKVLGVKANTISGYETGSSNPELNAFLELVELFEVSADELLFMDIGAAADKVGRKKKEAAATGSQELSMLRLDVDLLMEKAKQYSDLMGDYKNDLYELQNQVEEMKKGQERKEGTKKKKKPNA